MDAGHRTYYGFGGHGGAKRYRTYYDFNENLATEGVRYAVRGVWGMV